VDPPRVRQSAPRHRSPAASLHLRSAKTTHAGTAVAYHRYALSRPVLSRLLSEVGANGRLTVTPCGHDKTARDF